MAENKFRKTDGSVEEFLGGIENERKRKDSIAIVELMRQVTGEEPELWGSIVGFGNYHYRYESGREGDSPVAGFSPRKQNLTIYVFEDVERYEPLLSRLGKFKTGKVCIYINKLDDIDLPTLREIVRRSTEDVLKKYPN
jgi:hypothetical protein